MFRMLCNMLRANSILEETRLTSVEKALPMFAYIVGQWVIYRATIEQFQHFTETGNRHVYEVMQAQCHLPTTVIAPTHGIECHLIFKQMIDVNTGLR